VSELSDFLTRRAAESEARRLKDEFIALMSHELRTPLSSVLGYLELIEREECGPLTVEQRGCLAAIGRNANRLLALVGDLMLVARLEAGDISLQRAQVPLAELGAEAVEHSRADADAKGVELRLDTRAEPVVDADRMRLSQVLSNLLSNAVKFTPAGGGATLLVAADGGRALLEVADTGIGISDEERPQIYQPFFRTESARAYAVQGPGLGLAITKALVEAHGGTISCSSEEGTGSTFRVELPLPELGNGEGSYGVA
jgi:signal transduction histidine kinase